MGFIDLLAFSAHFPASGYSPGRSMIARLCQWRNLVRLAPKIREKMHLLPPYRGAASEISGNHQPGLNNPQPIEVGNSLLLFLHFAPALGPCARKICGVESCAINGRVRSP